MRFEVRYSTHFLMGTYPRAELLPTDSLIIRYNFKIKEYKMSFLFSGPHSSEFVSLCHRESFLCQVLCSALECLTVISDSFSHPSSCVPSYCSSWPWSMSDLTPCLSVSSKHSYTTCPLLHKVEPDPPGIVMILWEPVCQLILAPALVWFSSRFSPLWSCASDCELCFAFHFSNWQLLAIWAWILEKPCCPLKT